MYNFYTIVTSFQEHYKLVSGSTRKCFVNWMGAFWGCGNLEDVTLPSGLSEIGEYMFKECTGLKSITIPKSVQAIREYAFSGCSSLAELYLPENTTFIHEWAFDECSGLSNIKVASENPVYSSKDGVLFDKINNLVVKYPPGKLGESHEIPQGIESIGAEAFSWCENLQSVTVPEGVTEIEYDAFSDCSELKSVTIPKSVSLYR